VRIRTRATLPRCALPGGCATGHASRHFAHTEHLLQQTSDTPNFGATKCQDHDRIAFDVIVTTNLFGDILSDLASELSGSIGLAGSLMAGDSLAAAQAQHGSAPDIAGQNVANPTSMILSVAMLLEWLGKQRDDTTLLQASKRMVEATDRALEQPDVRTRDLGGNTGTAAFASHVAALIEAG
jgi:3-isopropylmalate dehydrogenase